MEARPAQGPAARIYVPLCIRRRWKTQYSAGNSGGDGNMNSNRALVHRSIHNPDGHNMDDLNTGNPDGFDAQRRTLSGCGDGAGAS